MKRRELKLKNKANSMQTEKTKGRSVLLYSIIAVIAGVLSGILVSSFIWKNEKVPSFKNIFSIDKSESDSSGENRNQPKTGTTASRPNMKLQKDKGTIPNL